MGSVTPPHLV